MNREIRNCPFCNGIAHCEKIYNETENHTFVTFQVFCDNCEASSRKSYKYEDAIIAWNRRYNK